MFDHMQLVLVGTAATIDTLVLLALSTRRNWGYAAYSVLLLCLGNWLWHVGAFVLLFMDGVTGPWTLGIGWLSRLAMVAGLLLMPSAMWHAVLQVEHMVGRRRDELVSASWSQTWAYLPALGILPAAVWLVGEPQTPFLTLIQPVMRPYLCWLVLINGIASWKFFRLRRRVRIPGAKYFLLSISLALLVITTTILLVTQVGIERWPQADDTWLIVLILSPLPLPVLFLYFVIRHNLMRLALKRTLVYGAVVVGVWLIYRLIFEEVLAIAGEEYRFNLQVLQGILIITLILAYRPLRERTLDALNYLMGAAGRRVRARTQRLALELSSKALSPPRETLVWFVDAVPRVLGLEYAAAWLLDSTGQVSVRLGAADRWRDPRVLSTYGALLAEEASHFTRHDAPRETVLESMEFAKASLVALLARGSLQGVLLFGRQPRNREPSDEEVNALLLLIEQLSITMNAGQLQAERLHAERRAMQNEKLSALGLLAGSIAHEVKNPLSSIRTIAAVLAEDLGPESPHHQDLEMIVTEVDRLAATTSELLRFAKPEGEGQSATSIGVTLERIVQMLRHLARERGVTLELEMAPDLPLVRVEENAFREIALNLIANSIEALPPRGKICIRCQAEDGFVVMTVTDDGPGIPEEIRETLFDPFVTTKTEGTGLGLYIVGRRVREVDGSIECHTDPARGSTFRVKLPSEKP